MEIVEKLMREALSVICEKFISMPERFAFEVTGTTEARVSHVAVIGDDEVGEVDR